MKIYLAGKVPKGDKEAETFDNWRLRYEKHLKTLDTIQVLDPNDIEDEGDYLYVVGFDCSYMKQADYIVVNAEQKLGAGTSQELVIAKYLKKPVITVLPKDSHHRRSNITFHGKFIKDWIHPFIHTFSDQVVENINEVTKEMLQQKECKDITIIDKAIEHYNKK